MAKLFNVNIPAISKPLKNIFESGELQENSVISILETTAEDGKNYQTKYYNLNAIISVGYRVNSSQATQFRIWATNLLREFMIKGFIMDDDRLKNGKYFGKDYFRELLEHVRSIRTSECRIYQQITDIFAECSIDYDKNSPDGRILKSDTSIAKNYLTEKKIKKLERTISGFFDYVENIIENRNTFTMQQFAESVSKFLTFNEYKVLSGKGTISAIQAKEKAHSEYEKFNKTQRITSDFDKVIKRIENKKKK